MLLTLISSEQHSIAMPARKAALRVRQEEFLALALPVPSSLPDGWREKDLKDPSHRGVGKAAAKRSLSHHMSL